MSKDHLDEHKLKKTPARVAILAYLHSQKEPIDVSMIMDFLEKNSITADPATIFRIMNLFAKKKIVRKLELKEGKFRYELSERPDHHHFICERCGRIEDISDCSIEDLQSEIEQKKGFLIQSHSLEFFGLCKSCASAILE